MRILYIFPGKRKTATPDTSATQLYGFDHLARFGLQADSLGRDDALPSSWPQERIGFRLRQALLYFKARSYDIVFGATLIYLMPLKKIFGGPAKYVALNIELNRILRGSAGLRKRFIISMLKEFSATICLSTDQKDWLLAQQPSLEGKVFFVPLGADTEFYQPRYAGRGDTVLSVGRDNGRDYRTLLAAAELLPETQFEIVCSPRNLAGIEHIPANVHVHYDLSAAEVRQKYETARMIVLTTHNDASVSGADCSGQTVLLDAMASGVPIIATRKAYLRDYVREGQDALIVEAYRPEQIVAAIRRLQEDAMLSTDLAKSARGRAESEFSTAVMAEGIRRIFTDIWNN